MRNKTTVPVADTERPIQYAPPKTEQGCFVGKIVDLHFHSRRYRLADPDGLIGKAVIDGLVDFGLLENDSAKEIRFIIHSQEKIPKGEPEETILTIEEV